jgi:hypothetical protein
MLIRRAVRHALLATVFAAGAAAPAFASSYDNPSYDSQPMQPSMNEPAPLPLPMPQPMHQGDVTYITGGIGKTAQRAIKSQAQDFNLAITNANPQGDFTTGTALTITTPGGRSVLDLRTSGPLLYAELPAGRYRIEAVNQGVTRVRDVTVSQNRATDVHLIWPQMG